MRHERCTDGACDYCETRAEARKEDDTPDYDESAAADSYERQFGL